jgi:P4 family phage/plasmid primase-like protien
MPVQIMGIRKGQGDGAFFGEENQAPSVQDVLANFERYLVNIPEHERYNIFFTAYECQPYPQKRKFLKARSIYFDIDNVDLEHIDDTLLIVRKALEIPEGEQVGAVCSGNGLHVYIGLGYEITDKDYFTKYRPNYQALCLKIDQALSDAGFSGNADPVVFDSSRLTRMPGTDNRKEKGVTRCSIISRAMSSLDWRLEKLVGLEPTFSGDVVSDKLLRSIKAYDTDAILTGCDFLKYCKDNQNEIKEPQWYAAVGNLARIPGEGRKLAHEYSKEHVGYREDLTDKKINHALSATTGPMTCKTIDGLWGKCSTCPNFNKVSAPILLQGPNFIKTQAFGFWNQVQDPATGFLKKTKPNYEDLKRYFEKESPYIVVAGSEAVYAWDGIKWREVEETHLKHFAHKNFDPRPHQSQRIEFMNWVKSDNVVDGTWFGERSKRKINFQNGIYDLDKKEFGPHNKDCGFTYVLPYEYEANANCPTFENFLIEVLDNDLELATIVLEFIGYAVSGDDYWIHKCLMLLGAGRNGKSTLLKVMMALVGKDAFSAVGMKELNNPNYLSQLDNKLFNISEETPQYSLMDSSTFKNLIGGGILEVRRLYENPYKMANRAKLIFATNDMPETREVTSAILNRLIIIPFDKTFIPGTPGFDPHLDKKLLAELPGIFNLVMQSYANLVEREHFIESQKVNDAITLFRENNEPLIDFVKECLVIYSKNSEEGISKKELYDLYREWTESSGVKALHKPRFVSKLKHVIKDLKERDFRPGTGPYRPEKYKGIMKRSAHMPEGINEGDLFNVGS